MSQQSLALSIFYPYVPSSIGTEPPTFRSNDSEHSGQEAELFVGVQELNHENWEFKDKLIKRLSLRQFVSWLLRNTFQVFYFSPKTQKSDIIF